MSPEEVVTNAILLFIAGHDSTVNTIAHCVLTVLRNPGSLELLRRRPELIPAAIEEVLRLQSAVQFFPTRIRSGRHRDRGDGHPEGFGHLPPVRRRQPRPEPVPQPEQIRSRTQGQRAPRLGQRHPRLLWRSARAPGGQPRVRDLPSPRGEPAARRRPAAVPASNVFRGPRHLLIDFDGSATEGTNHESIPVRRGAETGRAPRSTSSQRRARARYWLRSGALAPATLTCTYLRPLRGPGRSRPLHPRP